jgi:endonuclease YncB( thermonuclease family)
MSENNQQTNILINPSVITPELKQKLIDAPITTSYLNLENVFTICKVVSVYDGDSCKVIIPFKDNLYKWNVRLYGYDTPEMRPSRSKPNRDEEIKAAKAAKVFLMSQIMNQPEQLVFIKCNKFDKYGRLLAELYINQNDEKSVNQLMIDNNHGYAYHGGTKRVY